MRMEISADGLRGRPACQPAQLLDKTRQHIDDPIDFGFGRSSAEIVATRTVRVTGDVRHVGSGRALHAKVDVTPE